MAQRLIRPARGWYADELYALAAKTNDLCLSVLSWAAFRSAKPAIKLHRLLDSRGSIPSFGHISDGNMHEVNLLDLLVPEPGAHYAMDRGYFNFECLYRLYEASSFFGTRAICCVSATRNSPLQRIECRAPDQGVCAARKCSV